MPIARIENNAVAEWRDDLAITDVPDHKRSFWRPVVIEGDGPVQSTVIEADRVRLVRSHPPLNEVKTAAKARVSANAEIARHKYITPGSGKAMSYQEVSAEAKRHLATGGEGAYPFLQARVDSGRYANLTAARDGTLALEAQWVVVGAAIDKAEDQAKLAIDAATTVEQVQAAEPVTWP